MDRIECIVQLRELLNVIDRFESITSELKTSEFVLEQIENKPFTQLEQFDSEHRFEYIIRKIGRPPVKPKKSKYFAALLDAQKNKAYESELAAYERKVLVTNEEYNQVFKEIREEIDEKERIQRQDEIRKAKAYVDYCETQFITVKKEYELNNILIEKYKKSNIVSKLIEFLEEQRADNIKEAINLIYVEKERKRLENYIKQQIQVIEEMGNRVDNATELAEKALENAQQALQYGDDAIDIAKEAKSQVEQQAYKTNESYSRAEEAYKKAEEAYKKADDLYWQITYDN